MKSVETFAVKKAYKIELQEHEFLWMCSFGEEIVWFCCNVIGTEDLRIGIFICFLRISAPWACEFGKF